MMNELPLISVIVPAYNVSKYIHDCVYSIISQTYANKEIIIIDDGSTDETPSVLDTFFANNPTVTIVHKKNGGVSSARNYGLKIAHGTYIVFVDGDDYLSPVFLEQMYKLVSNSSCQFAISTSCYTTRSEKQTNTIKEEYISSDECSAILLNPDVIVGCWNKIYRKDFLDNNHISFNEKLYYGEGLDFILTCSIHATLVGVTNEKNYFYRRNNAESATTVYRLDKIINGEASLISIKSKIGNCKAVTDVWLMHMCMFYVGAICQLIICKRKKEYKDYYKKWMNYLSINLADIVKSKHIKMKRKIIIFICRYFPYFTSRLYIYKRKKVFKNSI